MTENKRFKIVQGYNDRYCQDLQNNKLLTQNQTIALLNELNDENKELKQSNKEARQILEEEFDFATEQRQKYLDDPVVTNAYDIVRFSMRKSLEKLWW